MELQCKFDAEIYGEYSCVVNNAEIIKPNTKIRAFIGKHLAWKCKDDVNKIVFEGCKLDYFPRGLAQHFPNLREVEISQCGLKELTKQDLVGLENLTSLRIDFNELETLQPDLLNDMKELKSISFFGNKLKFIDSQVFEPIKDQLTYLDLQYNTNIDALFDRDNEDSVGTIEQLMKIIDEKCAKPKFQYEIDEKKAQNAFENLWTSRRYSDFTIVVDKVEMEVHKSVLGTQSSVFAAMFETDMEESKSGQMTIVDFSASAFEEFLKFMYIGEVPEATNAFEVFSLAGKYEVKDLKRAMEGIIADNIDKDNAIEVLKLGNLHSSDVLISKAFDIVKLAYSELELPDIMKIQPENVETLIQATIQLELEFAEARSRFNLKRKLTEDDQ